MQVLSLRNVVLTVDQARGCPNSILTGQPGSYFNAFPSFRVRHVAMDAASVLLGQQASQATNQQRLLFEDIARMKIAGTTTFVLRPFSSRPGSQVVFDVVLPV